MKFITTVVSAAALAAVATMPSVSAVPVAQVSTTSTKTTTTTGVSGAAPVWAAPKGRVALEPKASLEATNEWNLVGQAKESDRVKLYFAVKMQNVDKLDAFFKSVSDPKNEMYGQYMTRDEVADMVASTESDMEAVQGWLAAHDVAYVVGGHRDMLIADVSVAQAETLLSVDLKEYTHRYRTEAKILRTTTPYTVPESVAKALDFVGGVTRFPNVRVPKRREMNKAKNPLADFPSDCTGCDGMITPNVLNKRYNVTSSLGSLKSAVKDTTSTQAVAEFQEQFYSPSDLHQFFSQCSLPTNTVAKVVGPNQASYPGVEAELDIQYIMGVGVNIPTWFWSLEQYSLESWIEAVKAQADAPLVHSVSYGNDEQQNDSSYMKRVNTEFQAVGAKGISIIVASGDQGAWGREGVGSVFHPSFPASSPYVTTVGATQFPGDSIDQEVLTNWSGGGFSTIFDAPDYQTSTVQSYLSSGASFPAQSFYNANGRAFPDVAVAGGNAPSYCITVSGQNQGVAGTSASTPAFAGMISLLNSKQLAAGNAQLGFLNPLIYSSWSQVNGAFDDIVGGENGAGSGGGLPCTAGWDATTGWGNPNFAVLENNLPSAKARVL